MIRKTKKPNLSDVFHLKTLDSSNFFTLRFLIISVLICIVSMQSGLAAEYYVSTSGDNNNTGLSIGDAWATPSYGVSKLRAGDTMYLLDGTWYGERMVISSSGTASDPITIAAYNGTPTLNGVDKTDIANFALIGNYNDHLHIKGISFENYYSFIVQVGSYIRIEDNFFQRAGYNGVIISYGGSKYNYFINNTVRDVKYNSVIVRGARENELEGGVPCENIVVADNRIYDNHYHSLIDLFGNMKNVSIVNNTLYNCTWVSIFTHDPPDWKDGLLIENNTIYDGKKAISLANNRNVTISNNTIFNMTDWVFDIYNNCDTLVISDNNISSTYPMKFTDNVTLIGNYLNTHENLASRIYRIDEGIGTIQNAHDDIYMVQACANALLSIEDTDNRVFINQLISSYDGVHDLSNVIYTPEKSFFTFSAATSAVVQVTKYPYYAKPTSGNLSATAVDDDSFTMYSEVTFNPTWISAINSDYSGQYIELYVNNEFYGTELANSDGKVKFFYDDSWDSEKTFSFKLDSTPISSSTTLSFNPSATSFESAVGESTGFVVTSDQTFTSSTWYLNGVEVASGSTTYIQNWNTAGIYTVKFDGTASAETLSRTWTVMVSEPVEVPISSISIAPSSTVVAPGESFSLDVYIDPTQALTGSQFDLQYSHLATISSVNEGNLFASSELATTFEYDAIDNAAGLLDHVYAAIVGSGTISSPGVMATINMVAGSSSGMMGLSLTDVILSDADSNPAGYTVSNATVLIDTAPEFSTIISQSVEEGQSLSFTATATDADGDDLEYSSVWIPSGASFNADTLAFSWTPSEGNAGNYDVTFEVTDGYLTDVVNVSITVTPKNHVPEITLFEPADGSTFEEGSIIGVNVAATDSDGDSLSYIIEIDGAQVSTATSYSWTTDYESAGTHTIKVTVSDGTEEVSSSGTITITDLQPRWDVNVDGVVNVLDITLVGQNYGMTYSGHLPRWDVNQDGTVNVQDLSIVSGHFGETV